MFVALVDSPSFCCVLTCCNVLRNAFVVVSGLTANLHDQHTKIFTSLVLQPRLQTNFRTSFKSGGL